MCQKLVSLAPGLKVLNRLAWHLNELHIAKKNILIQSVYKKQ